MEHNARDDARAILGLDWELIDVDGPIETWQHTTYGFVNEFDVRTGEMREM